MRIFFTDDLADDIEIMAREHWSTPAEWIRGTLATAVDDLMASHAQAEGVSIETWRAGRVNVARMNGRRLGATK